jgi:hypothetical protein
LKRSTTGLREAVTGGGNARPMDEAVGVRHGTLEYRKLRNSSWQTRETRYG